jgi:hypothetical protein
VENFLLFFILLEFFEIYWQRGNTFKKYIENLFNYYQKGIILFISLHPTLYFILFAQISLQNYNLLTSFLIFVKILDIGFKISLMDKIQNSRDLGTFKVLIETNQPLSMGLKFIGLIFYSTLFFFAFS